MTNRDRLLRRRSILGWGLATMPFLGSRPSRAQTLTALNAIPERLKGGGELRVASYGGTAQDAERKPISNRSRP